MHNYEYLLYFELIISLKCAMLFLKIYFSTHALFVKIV